MPRMIKEECLLVIIDMLRNQMIHTGLEEGLSSKKTIELSEKLDHYLMQYQRILVKSERKCH